MKRRTEIILELLAAVLAVWAIAGVVDLERVSAFEKPVFCVSTETADDGSSGHYVGLGYSFDIEGNFLPEDELPGVTGYTYFVFGNKMKTAFRD